MPLITALSIFALIAVIGGLLLALIAFSRIAFWRFRPTPLFANRAELWTLSVSLAVAILGSVWLLVGPAYSGVTYTMSISSSGAVAPTVTESSRSFYEVNGPKVILLFTVPVAFALLPFGFFRSRIRPIIQGLCAFLLGGQGIIGMSGYGLFYAPSGAIMLLAGILALKAHAAQLNAPTDAASRRG
jgi:hypothetical protein